MASHGLDLAQIEKQGMVEHEIARLARDSFLAVKSPPPPAASQFLVFVRGAAAVKILAANGAVPVMARQ